VRENACFLKELNDAKAIRIKLMDCLETAAFPGSRMVRSIDCCILLLSVEGRRGLSIPPSYAIS